MLNYVYHAFVENSTSFGYACGVAPSRWLSDAEQDTWRAKAAERVSEALREIESVGPPLDQRPFEAGKQPLETATNCARLYGFAP